MFTGFGEPLTRRLPTSTFPGSNIPPVFHIQRFVEGLYNPRMLAVANSGTVYVTQRTPGNLGMLRELDEDGVIRSQKVVLWLKDLHGIAIRGNRMDRVDVKRVYSAMIRPDGSATQPRVLTAHLPDAGQHPIRDGLSGSQPKRDPLLPSARSQSRRG